LLTPSKKENFFMDIGQYFIKDYTGAAFVIFGPAHLATLLAIILLNLWLLRFKSATEQTKRRVALVLAIALWLDESAWHIWKYAIGEWTIQEMLPLHLCSVLIWLAGFMLILKVYPIYEFVYFLGIGGALQALLTPDVGIYGFPHFRYFQTFISHGLLVTAGIYMTTVIGFRPTWKSIGRIFIVMNLYMVPIYFLNSAIGSNYLLINHKPLMATIMDALPAWPWYIPWIEVIALVTCLLLYIPFIIKDWRAKQPAQNAV
jgi:hypothetical integral membrane protein (TIGR02206 family)